MHASEIPAAALNATSARRGGVKPFSVDPAKTAHLVIDLQVGFLAPGAIMEVPVARAIVPNVNRIADAVRRTGGQNYFIRFAVDPGEPNYWTPFYERMTEEALAGMVAAFKPGAEPFQLWPDLEVRPEDAMVDKTRLSAFIPGTCDLQDRLKARGIDTLIITGTVTNACCESTARDAMQMGYKVLFIQDGNATWDDATHNATLANMLMFADVCTADEAIRRLEEGAARKAA
jgi:ureidoacrylate peracid hydrolase